MNERQYGRMTVPATDQTIPMSERMMRYGNPRLVAGARAAAEAAMRREQKQAIRDSKFTPAGYLKEAE